MHKLFIFLAEGLDVEVMNNSVPDDIRIFGLKRVTNNFNARFFCSSRTYTYTLPSIAFSHYNDQTSQLDYRVSSEKIKLVNDLLQVYKGSKNFHNFTTGKSYIDKSSIRQIKHLECGSPFLVNDVEFCVVRIQGRSFMMHQIRKMIGLMLAVIREVIDSSIFERVFTESITNCPTAPGLGLALDKLHYDKYNETCESKGFEKLTWEDYDQDIQKFSERYIQATIFQTEIDHQSMYEWLEKLLNYAYIPETDCDDALRNKEEKFEMS